MPRTQLCINLEHRRNSVFKYSSMELAASCNCQMCPCVEDTMISSSESVLSLYKARSGIPGGLAIAA